MHEVQASNNLDQRGSRFSVTLNPYMLGVNTSITAIYDRVF